jgi:hypothetical protein
MNNNELDNLVESFLSPKQNSKAMDLNELFALFESMEKANQLLKEVETQEFDELERPKPISRGELSHAAHLPIEYFVKKLARGKPQELETPEAQQVFYDTLRQKVSRGTNLQTTLENFVKALDLIKENKIKSFSSSLAYIMFSSSIFSMIKNYSSQTAGTFFETFIEFLGGKKVSISPHQYSIYDLVDDDGQYWSLKLTSEATGVRGSLQNMLAFFDFNGVKSRSQTGKGDKLWFLIVTKVSDDELQFNISFINLEIFLSFPSNHNPQIPLNAPNGQLDLFFEFKKAQNEQDKIDIMRDYGISDAEKINSFSVPKKEFFEKATVVSEFKLSLTLEEVARICSAQTHEIEIFRKKMKELLVDVDDIYFKTKTFLINNDPVTGQDASETAGRIEETLVEMTQAVSSQQKP